MTLSMLRSQPVPAPAPAIWRRIVVDEAKAERTKTKETWNDSSEEIDVSPAIVVPAAEVPGNNWITARLWLESTYAPAKEGDQNSPASAFWSWSGADAAGTTIAPLAKAIAIPNATYPRMSWVVCSLRVNVAGDLLLYIVYPGEEHTGKERGRRYVAVFEYTTQERPPR